MKIEIAASKSSGIKCIKPAKGGDPEVFLEIGGKICSSTDAFGVTGGKLFGFNSAGDGGSQTASASIFSDGYQAEINFEPSSCREIVIGNLKTGLCGFTTRKWKPVIMPAIEVDKKWLKTAPESVRISGCKPDFDAYNHGEPNEPVSGFDNLGLRFAGGHIMLSIREGMLSELVRKQDDVIKLVKLLDRIVGVTSCIVANSDAERLRRKYYGKPGCYRWNKGQYVEYRSMSNWWLASPSYAWVIYGMAELAACAYASGLTDLFIDGIEDERVFDIMLNCDRDKAIEALSDMMPALITISELDHRHPMSLFNYYDRQHPNIDVTLAVLLAHKPNPDIAVEWGFNMPSETSWNGALQQSIRDPAMIKLLKTKRASRRKLLGVTG